MAKLMLVEDDNNLREIYEARLQAEGYTIVSARDGEEALVVAKAEKPDLIISDVMMPKISGFEMLDILRNTDELKDVKVIMLTALGQTDDQQRAQTLGADRYLVKSQVTLEDIVKVTHDLLQDEPGTAATSPPATPAPDPAPTAAAPEPPVAASPAEPPATPPAPEPTPEVPVAPEPPAADPVPPAETAPEAQSEAQAEAAVESKIENFVAGATEDPTPPPGITPDPVAVPAADPAPDVLPTEEPIVAAPADPPAATLAPADDPATPAADTPVPAATVVDDKLMSDAVKALNDNVDPPDDDKEPDHPGSVPIANKKVIQPIDTAPKKDIEALLAIEEAKEKSDDITTKPPVVGGEGVSKPTDDPLDPHNIAL
ncbi:MAG TPA: response regulator [Candidatus Saccharimonadales bacterium]|jgi:CheY-like chemotaxis protein|nr:response regulator [Candidatus Saccharimonadales bacterium]